MLGAVDLDLATPTNAELREKFQNLSVLSIAPFLGRLATALEIDSNRLDLQDQLASMLLTPFVAERLANRSAIEIQKGHIALWVSASHIRLVLKLLLEHGTRVGGSGLEDPEVKLFIGSSILSVQEMYRENYELGKRPKGNRSWLYDFLLLKHQGSIPSTRPLDVLSHKESVYERIFTTGDLAARFEATYGTKFDDVHRGLAALWVAFSHQGVNMLRYSSEHAVDHRMLFGRFDVPHAAGTLILSSLAQDLRTEGSIPKPKDLSGPKWGADIRFLIDRPLAMVDDNLVSCLDFEFLQSAYARQVFNMTNKMLGRGSDEANQLIQQVGGTVFEETARPLFQSFEQERKTYGCSVWSPLEIGDLETDACIAEGGEVVLFELKAGVLNPRFTYGESVDALAEEIDKKYIYHSDRGRPKGFSQLAARAKELLASPKMIGLTRIKRLYPVIVVEDDTLPFKPMLIYALREAANVLKGIDSRVEDPVILHAEDLALLAQRSRRYSAPYMIKRILREGLEGVMSSRDLILRYLPVSSSELVPLERPFPMTHQVFEAALQTSPTLPSWECPLCGQPEAIYINSFGSKVRRCIWCVDSRETALPTSVIEEEKRWNDVLIARYLGSA